MPSLWPHLTPTHHEKSYPAIDPANPALTAKGKVVLVIGGSRGIGRYIALAFARAGAQSIALMGRDSLQATVSEISNLSPQAQTSTYSVDLIDGPATLTAFQSIKCQFSTIDVVVSSVGYLSDIDLGVKDAELEDWWLGYEVNVKGTFTAVQAFLRTAPQGATFISLNSAAAHVSYLKGFSSYSSSKMAVAKLLEDVQAEYPGYRVFSYHPGIVRTDMNIKAGFPAEDDMSLPASYAVWLASSIADPFTGRYLWAHWDVTELLEMVPEIQSKDFLTTSLKGWPAAPNVA